MRNVTILPLVLLGFLSGLALADISPNGRQVVILQPSTDTLWANYLFSIENPGKTAEVGQFPLLLPEEMIDFRPEEGLANEELILAGSEAKRNAIQIKKSFKPGPSLVGLSYNAPASSGHAQLTYTLPYDVRELLIMSPEGALELSGEGMTKTSGQAFVGRRYDMLRAENLKAGQRIVVTVDGIAEGRSRYWVIGGIAGSVILILGFLLAWFTRPAREQKGLV